MGRELGPEFYNQRLARFLLPLERSPWRDLYGHAADLVPDVSLAIADIGCGTGRLAKLLQQRGVTRYWGVDFAERRVEEAHDYVPEFEFSVGNVFDESVQSRFTDFDVFIMLEVLEHIEGDLDVLRAVPSGRTVVLSVPNFDTEGHVRWFRDADEVRSRYDALIDFSGGGSRLCERRGRLHRLMPFLHRPTSRIFVLSGVRR